MSESAQLLGLGLSLAIGLLIGLERGWRERTQPEGQRVAGVRTFALLGLVGGVTALLGQQFGAWLPAAGFLAVALFLTAAYWFNSQRTEDYGATSEIAALLTFALGALAAAGQYLPAAAAGVVTAVVLSAKPVVHRWISRVQPEELRAAFQLLLLLVVVLPVLPDREFGPYGAFNPFRIVATVGLLSALSFAAYLAIRIGGPRLGLLATGLLGGLVSSTAVTLSMARRARDEPEHRRLLSVAVLAACATMFVRMLLQVAAVHAELVAALAWPLLAGAGCCAASAWWSWRAPVHAVSPPPAPPKNPMELRAAVQFSLLLAGIGLAVRAAHARGGADAVYGGAALAAIADVDAVTLTLSGLAADGTTADAVAVRGIALAAAVNTAVKAVLAWWLGGRRLLRPCVLPLLGAALASLAAHVLASAGAANATL